MCSRELFSRGLVARYWKDPHKFMPERFLGDWPRDAFIPFSQGRFLFVSVVLSLLKITFQVPGLVWEDGSYLCGIMEISPHEQSSDSLKLKG